VGEAQFVRQVDAVASPDAPGGRRPFADAVNGQDGGFLERRRKERAGGVRLVVLGKDVPALVPAAQAAVDDARQVQFRPKPQRHGCAEGAETDRGVGQVRLEQTVELQQRLVVKRDNLEVGRRQAPFRKAVVDGVLREPLVVFLAREPLFLGSGHQAAVAHQAGGTVVVKR